MDKPTLRDRILGTWTLVSVKSRLPDGRVLDPLGPDPVGFLIYSADSYMSAYLQHRVRPRFASDDSSQAAVEELAAAARTASAYCGRYSVNEAAGSLIHHIAVSVFPNWSDTEQERKARFDGGNLVLQSVHALAQGVTTSELTWRRPG